MTADPQVLHTQLLDVLSGGPFGLRNLDKSAGFWIEALRRVVEHHKPEFFGGVIACLACSPGMPPPLLVEWKDCETVKIIASALGVET